MPEPQFSGDKLSWNSGRKLIAPTTAMHAGEATTGFFLRLAHLSDVFHAADSGSAVTCTLRASGVLTEPTIQYNVNMNGYSGSELSQAVQGCGQRITDYYCDFTKFPLFPKN
jgi:hypothetical protein